MKQKPHESMPKHAQNVKEGSNHWETKVECAYGIPNDPAGAFLPMSAKKRPRPYKKVNELDY